MKHFCKYTIIICLIFLNEVIIAQRDSLIVDKRLIFQRTDTNVTFQNKRMQNDSLLNNNLEIGAYVSTYYAFYTEDNNSSYVKHATMAARNKQIGLNMLLLSFNYTSNRLRSNIAIHFGDIAESTWPSKFNMIQEANAGFEVLKHLWVDVGVFKSHIGLESTQPRENVTSSMTLANVYEPYFFSGVKLTYLINKKLSLQINTFNSFNSIIENNRNKLFGTSIIFSPIKELSITYNFITGDETPDSIALKKQRYYNNLYFIYQKSKFSFAGEFNLGSQEHSKLLNSNKNTTAYMNSALLLFKHQTSKFFGFYLRGEWFSDEDEILSFGSNMGKYTIGATIGVEFKPLRNMAISLETRHLNSEKPNFYYNGLYSNQRNELLFCVDVWY